MDGSRFDDFTRALVTSRRGALKSLLGAAAAGVAAVVTGYLPGAAGGAAAQDGRQQAEARRGRYHRAGRRCDAGQPCGRRAPCTDGFCTPLDCLIDGTVYRSGDANPDNPCQLCSPTKDNWTEWLGAAPDGEACEIDDDAGCLNSTGQCLNGECVRDSLPDRTECGGVPGRVCCNGECCSPTECCNPAGFCEECGPHCTIDRIDYDEERINPVNPCEVCNPDADPSGWSPADDDTVCGGDLDDELLCCRGSCCGTGQCCNDGACGACGCEIDGREFEADDAQPGNKCQVCKPDVDRDDWTPQTRNAPCGTFNDRFCCAGECCPAGECCNSIGECEECGCEIGGPGGPEVVADAVNPANTCQVCKPDQDRESWTLLDDDEACGTELDDRVCCGGVCCEQGECCEDGACRACGCEIGEDEEISPDTINPQNVCQICKPSSSRLNWSPVDDDTPCGFVAELNQVCCDGECCDPGECCLLGACGECLCSIEGTNYAADRVNPANVCEVCKPNRDPFGWTTADDRAPCSEAGDRVCCAGSCCEPGQCCTFGVCGFCGCQIGGEEYDTREVNPANECEWCDPVVDPFVWSPRDGEPCGSNDDQFCCGSVCCPSGECCSLSGACEPCPCIIDGLPWGNGAVNPDDACQVCRSADSRDTWSAAIDDAPCGDNGDQECCGGICCPQGTCCDRGVCEPCVCTIGVETYKEFDVNPANLCQHCDLGLNPLDWSAVPENPPCGPNLDQRCCNGICCPRGACCTAPDEICESCFCLIDEVEYEDRTLNPDNECEICDLPLDPLAWTPMSEEAFCGPAGDQVCCLGKCCPKGNCCNLEGVCEPCRCEIGDQDYVDKQVNPENRCEYCDLSESTEAWTPTPDYSVCSGPLDVVNRYCCRGTCCQERECCLPDGTCGRCVCMIGDVEYDEGRKNPANDCQFCSPTEANTAWTLVRDGDLCGPTFDQTCCAGVCDGCESGCTIEGVHYADGQVNPNGGHFSCEVCNEDYPTVWSPRFHGDCPPPCIIDGALIPYGTINPTNACEQCDGGASWSPSDAVVCGDAQDRACCNGTCCTPGECCTEEGICGTDSCEPEGCMIDGAQYANGTINPDNECQSCIEEVSKTSWSSNGFGACGPNGDRNCAGGVCCDLGICPDQDVCGDFCSAVCAIGNVLYFNGDRNPANPCEQCASSVSHTSWTLVAPNFFCDPDAQTGACCEGTCCSPGMGCSEGVCIALN